MLRDIKDTNAPALALYHKLGFRESHARPVMFGKRAGLSTYVSMSLRLGEERGSAPARRITVRDEKIRVGRATG